MKRRNVSARQKFELILKVLEERRGAAIAFPSVQPSADQVYLDCMRLVDAVARGDWDAAARQGVQLYDLEDGIDAESGMPREVPHVY